MRFTMWTVLLVSSLAAGGLVGCGDTGTNPQTKFTAGGMRRIYECTSTDGCPENTVQTNDSCFTDPEEPCHPVVTTYQFYDPDQSTFDLYDCPSGCKTYPLGSTMGGKARVLLGQISSASDCQDVRNHVIYLLDHGLVRFYNEYDGSYGDTHMSQRGKLYDRIHLYAQDWKSDHQLAMTLMHEGYHSWTDILDDAAAEAFAGRCVLI